MVRNVMVIAALFAGVVSNAHGDIAHAQSQQSQVVATNGVPVTVHADEFAGRYELSGPTIDFAGRSKAWASKVIKGGTEQSAAIAGLVVYQDDWRFYERAILRGGEEVEGIFHGRDVISCAGSRYGRGCLLSEAFQIHPTKEQIASYATNGSLQVQLQSRRGENVIVEIPVSHLAAVDDVASRVSAR